MGEGMNHYANAIKIVTDAKTDFKALVVEIAKFNPGVIAKAHSRLNLDPEYVQQCRELAKTNKIEAIKLWRAHTGADLKDSKNAVEAL